ncbi:MAG: hypothetical protein J6X54_04045 [Treponema sp.]|nr:hypothetical protein [Treponema sp.]
MPYIIILIAWIFAPILLAILLVKGIKKLKGDSKSDSFSDLYTDEAEHDKAMNEIQNFETDYFARASNGEQTQEFLLVGERRVSSLIQSFLFSEGIPSYTDHEHINTIYSFNNLASSSAFTIKVYILTNDYDRAFEIVKDLVEKNNIALQEEQERPKEIKEQARKAVTVIASAGLFIPLPDGSRTTSMGITILPKKEKGE